MRDEPFADRYTLLERLSAGATGEVWRAHDLHRGRVVALKRWTEVNADPRRHASEVAALQAVRHPCVPSLVDHGRALGLCYVAMTLFEGETLRAVLNGPLSPAAVRALGLAVCDPLGAVHRAGLVHRDVKPEHLVLDTSVWPTRVSLVDLGLAHAQGAPRALTAGGWWGAWGISRPSSSVPRRRPQTRAGTCSPWAACSRSVRRATRPSPRETLARWWPARSSAHP